MLGTWAEVSISIVGNDLLQLGPLECEDNTWPWRLKVEVGLCAQSSGGGILRRSYHRLRSPLPAQAVLDE